MVPAKVLLTLGAAALIAMLLLRRRAQRRDPESDVGDDSPGSATGWLRGLLPRGRKVRPEPRHRRSRPRLALTVSGVARSDEPEAEAEPGEVAESFPPARAAVDVPDVPRDDEAGAVSAPGWPEPGELAFGADEDDLDPTPGPDDGPFDDPEGAENGAWADDGAWAEDDDWAAGEPLAQVGAESGPADAFAFADGDAWQPPDVHPPDPAFGGGGGIDDGVDGFDPATGWLDAEADAAHPAAPGAASAQEATSAAVPAEADAEWEDDGVWSTTEWDAPLEEEPPFPAESGDPSPSWDAPTEGGGGWTPSLPEGDAEVPDVEATPVPEHADGTTAVPTGPDVDAVAWDADDDPAAPDDGGLWGMSLPAEHSAATGIVAPADIAGASPPAAGSPDPVDTGHAVPPAAPADGSDQGAVPDGSGPVASDTDDPGGAWSLPVESDAARATPARPLIVDIVGVSDTPLSLAISPGTPGEEPTAWLVSGDWNVAVDAGAVRLTPPDGVSESAPGGGAEQPAAPDAQTRTIEDRLEAAERELERIAKLAGIPATDAVSAARPEEPGPGALPAGAAPVDAAPDALTEMVQREANRRVAEVLDRHGAVSDTGDVDGLVARLSELSNPPAHPGG